MSHKKLGRPIVGPLQINANLTDDPNTVAEVFAEAFPSVFVAEPSVNPLPHQLCRDNLSSVQFPPSVVEALLKSLDGVISVGPDSLHIPPVKRICHGTFLSFSLVFNMSMVCGSLPQSWKLSHVTSVSKKGSRGELLNYRPISLNPVPCKVMECIISNSLFGLINYL